MNGQNILKEKMKESIAAVLPITLIVAFLCLFFVPLNNGLMLSFLIGAVLITVGMGLFSVGSDISMSQIGIHIGAKMTKSRKLWLILSLSFILGVIITIAEPDLQVLATNVPDIDSAVLLITVSIGVGIFLLISMLRILFRIPLNILLIVFYVIIFVLAFLSSPDFLSVSFDSGGVTTGPMTVPFIMALGIGVASIRSDADAKSDSFGLVALCSIGPILAVLLLGFIYNADSTDSAGFIIHEFESTKEIGLEYLLEFPEYMKEIAIALLPIFAFFMAFQLISLKLKGQHLTRIFIGFILTFVGLVLFMTGVNVGFSSVGYVLGGNIAESNFKFLLIPLAMVMGWFIINAEPAVQVLNKQVEELSAGAISAKAMGVSLSIAIALAMGLAMVRVLTGVSIMWFVVPGYFIALALSFFVPKTFTAIAFDSGGVASGPLTATFMLPFAMGATAAVGGNIMTDAFGIVALVAMMPLITVQIMGAITVIKSKQVPEETAVVYKDDDIIELWEVA